MGKLALSKHQTTVGYSTMARTNVTLIMMVSAYAAIAYAKDKPDKRFFGGLGGGAYGGQQFGGAAGLGNLASAFGSLTGGLNGLGGNGIGTIGSGLNSVGGGYGIGGGLGGVGGVGSSGSCRYWCRTPQSQSYCCESGQGPPVRPQCPPTRAGFRPPAQCSNDSRCPGAEKCCFDTCLQHHTCKLPTSYYG